jgi:hypothetical protein
MPGFFGVYFEEMRGAAADSKRGKVDSKRSKVDES